MTVRRSLVLDYTLGPGWMAPYVSAVLRGEALARRCADCARVSFPPSRTCPCGAARGDWILLSGEAEIVHRAAGADGDFALARFDGADTSSTLRLLDMPPAATRGALARPESDLPALVLRPLPHRSPG